MKPISTRKVWLAGTVVFASAIYLVISSLRTAGFSELPIDQVRAASTVSRVKMSGKVLPGSALFDAEQMCLRFRLVDDKGDQMTVVFQGIRPNAFRDGAQVMVEGYYDRGQDQVKADVLLAKCPSRYEEEGNEHPDQVAL